MTVVSLISEPRKDLLKLLLKDRRISDVVLTNGEIPQSIQINNDGSVTFGRTPRHWWNFIFGDTVTISFIDLSFKMLAAFSQYLPKKSSLPQILTEEIIENAVKQRKYDFVIDRFVMYAFLGVTEGDYKLNILQLIDESPAETAKNTSGKKTVFGKGTAFLDLGHGSIPIGIRIEEDI